MAKVQVKLKKPSLKGWTFVLLAGLALAVLAVLDSGRLSLPSSSLVPAADGSTGCQFRVTVREITNDRKVLNVRDAPSVTAAIRGTVDDGTLVDTIGKPTNGFRELEGGNWVSADHLTLVSGTDCG